MRQTKVEMMFNFLCLVCLWNVIFQGSITHSELKYSHDMSCFISFAQFDFVKTIEKSL